MKPLPKMVNLLCICMAVVLTYPIIILIEGLFNVEVPEPVWVGIGAVMTKLTDVMMELVATYRTLAEKDD